jgi:sensor domain CHASE-containing protein
MEYVIWIGAVLTMAGVAGLGWCIWLAIKARRKGLDQAAMQAELQRVVTLNVAALGVSALGLAAVVMGIVLR